MVSGSVAVMFILLCVSCLSCCPIITATLGYAVLLYAVVQAKRRPSCADSSTGLFLCNKSSLSTTTTVTRTTPTRHH